MKRVLGILDPRPVLLESEVPESKAKGQQYPLFPGDPGYKTFAEALGLEEGDSVEPDEAGATAEEVSLSAYGGEQDMNAPGGDVPGADLDDAAEKVGSEDEENNYYSIGGDDHNDLEESAG